MNILLWHVHGAWTTAFVSGRHTYYVPVTPDRGPDGRGRARTYRWPDTVIERTPDELAYTDIDVVVLQRPTDFSRALEWTRRRPGRDIPAVYVEHNTPRGDVPHTRHPYADRSDVRLVHVTHFNNLFWDNGYTDTTVIEHGIPDPGRRYVGDQPRLAAVMNEPIRRGRVTGTDLLPRFAKLAGLDVFGMGVQGLSDHIGATVGEYDDPPQAAMHEALVRRRAYVHTTRWTSLGLSLLEAMSLGIPAVVVATTEAAEAIPPGAAIVSTNIDTLVEGARWLLDSPDEASRMGRAGRHAVQSRYGLGRFLDDWDRLLSEVTRCASR
jgi:hypothetical protein